MDNLGTNSAAPLNPRSTTQSFAGAIHKLSQPSPPSPTLFEESPTGFAGWEPTNEERASYDGRNCLDSSHNLTSERLGNRRKDEVVIFDYSLNPDHQGRLGGDPPVERGGPSSERFSAGSDIFFRVSKNGLVMSKQFDRIINPTKPRPPQSWGPRLGVIDFPQCYDTHDDILVNSMGEKLGLQREGETAFIDAYLRTVRTLPGRGRFRTGVSLREPFKEPLELSRSEDRFVLFVSFPYFGGSSEGIALGPESESVNLLDFKRLVVDVPAHKAPASKEERDSEWEISAEEGGDSIGKILVHQARYMIFDNYIMAAFRSKEDSTKDQVPLHPFQERLGAFNVMVHMAANRMKLELWTLGKLQASLCKLEEDIDEVILEAKTCERNQEIRRNPADRPQQERLGSGVNITEKDRRKMDAEDEQVRQNNVWERKQRRIRCLLASLNTLAAALFAAISVAERQITILQDLHGLFLASCRTKIKDYEKGYPLQQSTFHNNVAPIPILSENSEQIWPNTLETIDEAVRERKSFIKRVKELVENMDIRRKILSAFLKSDQAKAVPFERTAQETMAAIVGTEETLREIGDLLMQQGHAVDGFTFMNIVFLPLNFCASYYGMQTVKEFGGNTPKLSLDDFWLRTAPAVVGILIVAEIIILWNRTWVAKHRKKIRKSLPSYLRNRISDPETASPQEQALTRPNSQEQPLPGPPPPHREGSEGSSVLPSNSALPSKEQRPLSLRSRNERHSGSREVDKLQSLNSVYPV